MRSAKESKKKRKKKGKSRRINALWCSSIVVAVESVSQYTFHLGEISRCHSVDFCEREWHKPSEFLLVYPPKKFLEIDFTS